jgi:hypothetical protein
MPPYIRKAEIQEAHLKLPLIRAIKESYYIIASWQDMKAIIKAVMIRHPSLFLKITSDREIVDVSLGKTSRNAKGGEEKEGVYNSVQDLMDPPGLAVVRLNDLAYKNKAASGYLTEALSHRLDREKPTWLISDRLKPFGGGSPAWSPSVMDLIFSSMKQVQIPIIAPQINYESIAPEPVQNSASSAAIGNSSISTTTTTASSKPEVRERPFTPKEEPSPVRPSKPKPVKIQSASDDDENPMGGFAYGSGLGTPKKPFGRG